MLSKYLTADLSDGLRLAYQDSAPTVPQAAVRGTIVLLHGFPQTSHQFRLVTSWLCDAGYRCIAPDYRGAGLSSKPTDGFTKSSMAGDLVELISHLGLTESSDDNASPPIHLVGHDIGGMIAWSLASQCPHLLASVCWGECPLPGTTRFDQELSNREREIQQFHFLFHAVPDLPEALISGREEIYVHHFLHKITNNHTAFPPDVVRQYAETYAQPGGIRCAMEVYRAFGKDVEENRDLVRRNGKVHVPTLLLNGEFSRLKEGAEDMAKEVTEENVLEVGVVGGASHYLAEENPEGFAKAVMDFLERVEREGRWRRMSQPACY